VGRERVQFIEDDEQESQRSRIRYEIELEARMSIFQQSRPKVWLALALTLGLTGIGIAANSLTNSNPPAVLKMAAPDAGTSHTGFAPVVKRVMPAVVKIESTKVTKVSADGFSSQRPDSPFGQFFGEMPGRQNRGMREAPQRREQGVGSGVIMTSDGYILTNNHVIDGATGLLVKLVDGREFKARVIGADPKSDIAVLKVDGTNLPYVTVGDSAKLQVGDFALAIGNPFGVGQSVTMGIVSATGRSQLGIEEYEDFIQTDAPINPGNSGGALVNDRGDLIGINTAIIAHGSAGNQGIGFAVPINMARNVMDQIVKDGKVTRAYLGVLPQDVSPAIAKAFGKADTRGALVGDVTPNSPASRAGIEKGDIVVDVNGAQVVDSNHLRMTISMMAPESTQTLRVLRNGEARSVKVQLAELPTTTASAKPAGDAGKGVLSGVSVEDLDPNTASQLGLPATAQGVVVTNVAPSSEAAAAGLKRGDVIQEVNRQAVKNSADFDRAVGASKEDTLLLVNRRGSTLYLAV